MRTLNLGILAHVDAGKTSLTERLLHAAGVIDHIGRVDDGTTQTDTLTLERQRGITIKSAVTSFTVGAGDRAVTVNLIDTPGHPDFIAEVERVLDVLDGVVLVVSAVEGVQAQTRILTRAIRRLGIPMVIFVNKIDRAGARTSELIDEIARRLQLDPLPMGRAVEPGCRAASFMPYGLDDPTFRDLLLDKLTVHDDQLLAAALAGDRIGTDQLQAALVDQTAHGRVQPVYFGSAMTGAGIADIMAAIGALLPAPSGDDDGDPSAVVFKIDRGAAGERIAYLRVFSGVITARSVLPVVRADGRPGNDVRITAIKVFDHGVDVPSDRIPAGRIGRVWGLADVRIGDVLGTGSSHRLDHYFTPPSLETVVAPVDPADRGALRTALDQLAQQDPLINVRQDDVRSELSVSLYGEVQKQVIGATLAMDFGIPVTFAQTSTICVERPAGVGAAVELMHDEDNPFLATVGLRVEPGQEGSGVRFGMDTAVHGTMPPAFFKAVEETVLVTSAQALHGWRLVDAVITLTHTGYAPRQSHAHQGFNKAMSSTGADFRDLTPLVLMAALREAGTVVLEPIHHFRLEVPNDVLTALYPVLAAHRAVPRHPITGPTGTVIDGDIPAAEIHALEQELPGLTRGEGVLETSFDRYQPVTGQPPERPRTDHNPLNRKEYLLRTTRGRGALV